MKFVRKKKIEAPIILVKHVNNDEIVVVDSNTTVMFLDIKTLKLINGFKAKIKHEYIKNRVVDFSNNSAFFTTLSEDSSESRLYNAQTKKAISKVSRHHGVVSCVGIDNASKYMFSCGDDGKTFVVDIKSGKIIFTLPPHVDTINDIAFSDNNNWLATCSYDRKISIFNLSMMMPKHMIKISSPVLKVMFFSTNRLLSISKDNVGTIWDIYSGQALARISDIHDDVTQIAKSKNSKFLFIGTDLGHIIFYDLEKLKLLSRSYIKLDSSITSLLYDDENNHLIIGTKSGELQIYDIYEGKNHIRALLEKKQLDEIHEYVKRNPALEYTDIYQLVLNLWDTTLEKAKKLLEKNEKEMALKLFEHFKAIPSKNKIIQNTIKEYADFGKFVSFAKEGKLALAYGLANQNPSYKESSVYKSLEAQWTKRFKIAQKYILDPAGADKAKETLAPYRGINEKTKLVQELSTKANVYKLFRTLIGKKDFFAIFNLMKQHKYLKDFPEYETIMDYADSLYFKAQDAINAGQTNSALKMLRILRDFSDYSQEVEEMMVDIENKQRFFKAVAENKYELAYTILSESEILLETDDGKRLNETWEDALENADILAARGDAMGVKKELGMFLKIPSKYMYIATVFAWCYMVQIEQAIKNKQEQIIIEKAIKEYVSMFGLQDYIMSLFEIFIRRYPESKLNLELQTKGSMEMWRPTMIIESIID